MLIKYLSSLRASPKMLPLRARKPENAPPARAQARECFRPHTRWPENGPFPEQARECPLPSKPENALLPQARECCPARARECLASPRMLFPRRPLCASPRMLHARQPENAFSPRKPEKALSPRKPQDARSPRKPQDAHSSRKREDASSPRKPDNALRAQARECALRASLRTLPSASPRMLLSRKLENAPPRKPENVIFQRKPQNALFLR